MTRSTRADAPQALSGIRWQLRLTWAGMCAETLVQALWPLLGVVLLVMAALMLGLQDSASMGSIYGVAVVVVVAAGAAIVYAVRQFRVPTRMQALTRLDASLPGRPIQALMDEQAIGAGDVASMAVWQAHQTRMAARAASAQAVPADLRVSDRDPFALRYVALLAFAVALIFGSVWRVGSVAGLAPGAADLANGPVWEGWAEPPRYTGRPTLYLSDLDEGNINLPNGTLITLRLYGEVGALEIRETVSGTEPLTDAQPAPALDFTVNQSGEIAIDGPGGRSWTVTMLPDAKPHVEFAGDPEVVALGEVRMPFAARDDYGVEGGEARITIDLASVDRRYGLTIDPDPRPELVVQLPMPIAGDRTDFEENLIDDFSKHPWANLPVTVTLSVLDASEQQVATAPKEMILPGRRFFDPMAAAVIEQRRDLLWSKANATRMAQVLRAVSYRPDDIFRSATAALRLRRQIERLEIQARYGLTDDVQADIAEDLWNLAIELEEGVLADALERMRRAQERLTEAMRNGASNEEIAELMDELRRATEEYMQQLQRQQAQEGEQGDQQQGQQGETMQMTQDDLQRMMDRIQELMEQGRMAEAEQALRELQEMMENMRVTQGQPGQGGQQSPGQQAMEGLADTLREQQDLSDQAFRDLQEQFNPNGQEGQQGQQGQGQQPGQEQGQQQGQNQPGQQGQDGQQPGQNQGQGQGSIADRQQALRDELRRQEGRLPGGGSPEGEAARDALDRAGRAMDGAEQALRENDLSEAIDNQSQAMEALREGMRALGDAMAQEQQQNQPGQGMADGNQRADNRDPLGRDQGTNGAQGTDGDVAIDNDAYGRARELLDEIRRRSGEAARPEVERDYLNRLLDRF